MALSESDWCEVVILSVKDVFGEHVCGDGMELWARFWIRMMYALHELQGNWSQVRNNITFSCRGLLCYIHLDYDKIVFTADKRIGGSYRREHFLEFIAIMKEPHELRFFPKLDEEEDVDV